MSEDDPEFSPDPTWPPRSEFRTKRARQAHLRVVERETERTPVPVPTKPRRQIVRAYRRALGKCSSCGENGGLEVVTPWRNGWYTSRCC